jgi:hypothetical protein
VTSYPQLEDSTPLPLPKVFDLLVVYDSPNLNQRKIANLLDYVKTGGNILIPYSIIGKEAFEILSLEADYKTEFYSVTDKKAKYKLAVKDDKVYLGDQEIDQDNLEEDMLYHLSIKILGKQKESE